MGSALHLPEKDVPIIMIGAGAGVAPFRGFWNDLRTCNKSSPAVSFFGCRNADKDWLYKEEMSGAVKLTQACAALARMQVGPKRPLAGLFTAFSRPGEGKTGEYVQDQLKKQAKPVKHWVEKLQGTIYICGSSAMGNGVLDALSDILEGGRPTVDALRRIELWQSSGGDPWMDTGQLAALFRLFAVKLLGDFKRTCCHSASDS